MNQIRNKVQQHPQIHIPDIFLQISIFVMSVPSLHLYNTYHYFICSTYICYLYIVSPLSRPKLSDVAITIHVWLLKLIEMNVQRFSSLFALATFQVLRRHMCLVITILHIYKTFLSFQEVLLDSIVLECKVQERKNFFFTLVFFFYLF